MERNVFICIIVSLCMIAVSTSSSSKKSHDKAKETPPLSTTFITSGTPTALKTTFGASSSVPSLNETITMRSSRKRLKERRYVPPYPSSQYTPSSANYYCPPLASSCPSCIAYDSQLPQDICSYPIVMKVLMLSPPSTDLYGRVCGKLGLLAGLANTEIKQYRRLLRFSLQESCGCILNASQQYILISKPSAFTKDGSLHSKISISHEVILLPVDRDTESVTLRPLELCKSNPQPDVYGPESTEYIGEPIQPRSSEKKVVSLPVPPPISDLYLTPLPPYPDPYSAPNPDPYLLPAEFQMYVPSPSTFYMPPYPPMSLPLPGPISYKLPSFLPVLTNCLQEESCPKCLQPGELNLEQEYCTSDFAFIALLALPDLSKAKGDYSNPYQTGSCLNLRTTVLHDVSKSADAKLLSIQLNLLLPRRCSCFPQLKGFAIVLLLGRYTNSPIYEASPQLTKEYTLIYLPAPSEISIPNCALYPAPTPYVPPVQDLQVYPVPNCPYGIETSCPSCFTSADQAFIDQFCASKVALVAELQGSGAYAVLAPKIPSVQITTSEDQYSYKSISIKVIKSSPPSCIEGSLKILQIVKPPQDYYTLPSILTYTILSECLLDCALLTGAPGTKILLYSSNDIMPLPNGVIQLTKGIYLASLGAYENIPACPGQYILPEPEIYGPVPYVTPSPPAARFPDYPTVYSVVASMVVNPEIPPANIYGPDPPSSPISPEEYALPYTNAPSPPNKTVPPPLYKTAPPQPYVTAPPPAYTTVPPLSPYSVPPPPPPTTAPTYKTVPPQPYATTPPQSYISAAPVPYPTSQPPPPTVPPYKAPPPSLYVTVPPLPYTAAPPSLPYKTTSKLPYTAPPPSPYTVTPSPSPYIVSPTPPYKAVPKLPITTASPPYASVSSPAVPPPAVPPPVVPPPPVNIPSPPEILVKYSSPYAFAEYKPCLENDFSCPECSYSLPPNFRDAYCMANAAILVAIGLNYTANKEYEDPKQLAFKPPGPPYINIQSGIYGPGLDVTASPYTPYDVIAKQNAIASQFCFKDTARALYDVTRGIQPKKLDLDIDVYIPALCPDCPAFLQSPIYAIILSKQPLYLNRPIQLTSQFHFYPLPLAKFSLPDCYSDPDYPPESSYALTSVDKYQVPAYPVGKQLSCDYPAPCKKCPDPPPYPYFEIPCDQKLALVVEILETSAGKPGAPSLEVSVYQKHIDYYVTYVVALDIKDSPPAPDTSGPYKNANSCKYAKVKVIQDLSPYPVVQPGTVLTVLAVSDCDCNIFAISQGFGILLAPEYNSGTTITIGPASAIILPFGYSSISLCSEIQQYSPAPPPYPSSAPPTYPSPAPTSYPSPELSAYPSPTNPPPVQPTYSPPVPLAPTPAPYTDPPYVPPVQTVTKPPLPPPAQVDIKYGIMLEPAPTSLLCNENALCSICGSSADINANPKVYCDSQLVLLIRVSKIQKDEGGKCASGAAISMYEVTASKQAQKAILNIFFTLPQKCLCPQIAVDKFALLMIHKSIPITNPLVLELDSSFHLYSVPKGRLTLPFCEISQFVPRTRDLDEIFVDPVDKELTDLRRKEMNLEKCPTNERSCPKCDYMDIEDIKELICSSDFAFEVIVEPKLYQGLRRHDRRNRVTVSQHLAKNFSIDIVVKPYEGPGTCNSPVADGNCNSKLKKFYFDADDHKCKEFIYSGCNGNANNFNSYLECEESCMKEGYCDDGSLFVQNNPRNKYAEDWRERLLKYFVEEDCDCQSLTPDSYCKYLVYNSSDIKKKQMVHLGKDFYFIPLSEAQRMIPISCSSISGPTNVDKIKNYDTTTPRSQGSDFYDKIYDKNDVVTNNDDDETKDYNDSITKYDEYYPSSTKNDDIGNDLIKSEKDIKTSYVDSGDFTTYDPEVPSNYEDTKYGEMDDSEENDNFENGKTNYATDEHNTDDLNADDDSLNGVYDTNETATKKGWGIFGR